MLHHENCFCGRRTVALLVTHEKNVVGVQCIGCFIIFVALLVVIC